MRNKRMKQIWACLLTALLLFSQAGTGAYAKGTQGEKDTGGLCGHHLAHTQDCGYTEGSPCGHEHDENCYSLVTKCVYEEEGGDATPSDAEEQKHECSEERDCIKRVLDCRHTHDETCGYEKAHLCRYVCDICGGKAGSVPDENRGLEGETPDADCICETRCIRYLVNGDCPVCAENERDCRGAKEPVIEGGTVMAFSRLGRAVEKQEVKAGTALEKLKLPHSLEASVYSEDEADDGDTVTAVYIEVLSWNSEPAYEGEPGTYVFTPEPVEDYPLQNGVALPNITVTVVKREDVCICTALCGEEFANGDCPVCKEAYGRCAFSERGETEAAKEVCALIDALPTVERIYDDVVGDSDPAYEKWLADMKGTLKQIGETGACFDRLGVQEKEFVGQERAGKLENLRDFADRLGQRAILAVGQSFTEGNLEYQVTSAEPAEVDVIGYYGRIGTLDSLEIPGEATGTSAVYNVTGIGDSVFSNCYSLTELTLPDGMKRIGNSAFSNCYSLEELTLPDTLERIGESAFLNCSSLTELTLPDSVVHIGDSAFSNCQSLGDLTLSDSVEKVGDSVFSNCISLTELTLPNSVKRIGDSAFSNCGSLTKLTLPVNLERIGESAFLNCYGLGELILPHSVQYIGDSAFFECQSLEELTLPANLDSIGESVFYNCASLTGLNLPDGVGSIGNSAFYNCQSLENLTLSPNLKHIGESAFTNCGSLIELTLPANLERIGESAFSGCTSVKLNIKLKREATVTPLSVQSNTFGGAAYSRSIVFLDNSGNPLRVFTTPTLEAAAEAYKSVNDGDSSDNSWYGWDLPVPHSVSITVHKDGVVWAGHGRTFYLVSGGVEVTDLKAVWDGTYDVYDVTERGSGFDGADTGVDITVSGADVDSKEPVDYYTVTFYDGNIPYGDSTEQKPQIILKGQKAKRPADPAKADAVFGDWKPLAGTDGFDFEQSVISSATNLYARWREAVPNAGFTADGADSGATSLKPAIPVEGTTQVRAQPGQDNRAAVTVTTETIADAIRDAEKRAAKKGVSISEISVVVQINTPDSETQAVTVNLPKAAQETIISNRIGRLTLAVEQPDIRVSLNLSGIQSIYEQAGADVQVKVAQVANASLSGEAMRAVGDRPAFQVTVSAGHSGKQINSLNQGSMSLEIPYTQKEGEEAGNLYAVAVDENGGVDWLKYSSYDAKRQTLVFASGRFSIWGIAYQEQGSFSDISGHWAKDDIEFAASRGFLKGTGSSFSPDSSLTRGMLAAGLGGLAGVNPADYPGTGQFADVPADAFYSPFVEWAVKSGIMKGTGADSFAPEGAVTREEMAAILVRYAKQWGQRLPAARDPVAFADGGQVAEDLKTEVGTAWQAGIMAERSEGKFEPKAAVTRAEAAAALRRYVEVAVSPERAQGFAQNHSGQWRYYEEGKPAAGWKQAAGRWYCFDGDGFMQSGGWSQISGKWYYFHADGSMAVNTNIDGYELGPDGEIREP